MNELSELKEDLSSELKKGKYDRNYDLIRQLHSGIQEQKSIMHLELKNGHTENTYDEDKLRASYYKKLNDRYAKIRSGGGLK